MFDKNFEKFLNDKIVDYGQIGKFAGKRDITVGKTLDNMAGISVGLASKEQVRSLSYGEVLISETINYRTQRPERGGLFCEQIFGPRKNYECACGKYKRIKYKGIICERCGVEVTTSQVRRARAGHIELAAPVAHIWYLKSIPSRIGLLLDISIKKLEQVIYFASYLITDVYEDKRQDGLRDLENIYKTSKIDLQKRIQNQVNDAQLKLEAKEISKEEFKTLETTVTKQLDTLDVDFNRIKNLLKTLKEGIVIGELDYRILYDKFPHIFRGGSGAEYVKILLERIDLKKFIAENQKELKVAPKAKQKKILQRLKLASSLFKSEQRPENFVLEALLVIPPDLRPMIQLDGGRFASSDLNDLYRRVINRNNRLRKLTELGAPDVILKNEKRMLQEAVDMLINGDVRSNRPGYITATKKKLKSLADILKGKQGRFRQNLLGKRVDYSGRSVIVAGPKLKMNECGLPKLMALTLFKPFVIQRLIENEIAFNVKHAEKVIEERGKEVWDALDEVIVGKYVLLNRAPTLHRLGMQAFRPVLIEGKAIQLHPLSCAAFNADFDGDQMAVHVPLTVEAQREAGELMVPSKNVLSPSNGEPIISPSQDMILGSYYLTKIVKGDHNLAFCSIEDAGHAYQAGAIKLHTPVKIRIDGKLLDTTYGRSIFNKIIPVELGYANETMTKGALKKLLSASFELLGSEPTAYFADAIKNIGYHYATQSGLTFSKEDLIVPAKKGELVKEGEEKIKEIQKHFWMGYVTEYERYLQSIRVWINVKGTIEKELKTYYTTENPLFNMIDSKARGDWGNMNQLSGMTGLVASPSGKTIELPIKSNLREGFTTLEYFIATHGGRKGKADTALKTAQSGYLTRRLVDAAQNVIVSEEDCNTLNYKLVTREEQGAVFQETFEEKIYGKSLARDVVEGKNVLLPAGTLIDKKTLDFIKANKINEVAVRSVLTCDTEGGICQRCYGLDLGYNYLVKIGTPTGVIAAQSIGEPGTQLTMRTFHTGGLAKEGGDITMGLTRVEELFEARKPKYEAVISDVNGKVTSIKHDDYELMITVTANELETHEYYLPSSDFKVLVKKKDQVNEKQVLAKSQDGKNKITSSRAGIVEKIDNDTIVIRDEEARVLEYITDLGRNILVKKGDKVKVGEKLCEGHIDTHKLMDLAGPLATEEYIVNDVKAIYASQGQTVNSKHIELIVRQMFAKVKIISIGDSSFFPGDVVEMVTYKKENDRLLKLGQKPAIGHRLLLGLTKASLFTESWLAAASFQETVRVLVDASVSGKIDHLTGLKENVIIGRLIPTLQYYKNNQNVGDYFDYNGPDDEVVLQVGEYSSKFEKEDLVGMEFDEIEVA